MSGKKLTTELKKAENRYKALMARLSIFTPKIVVDDQVEQNPWYKQTEVGFLPDIPSEPVKKKLKTKADKSVNRFLLD